MVYIVFVRTCTGWLRHFTKAVELWQATAFRRLCFLSTFFHPWRREAEMITFCIYTVQIQFHLGLPRLVILHKCLDVDLFVPSFNVCLFNCRPFKRLLFFRWFLFPLRSPVAKLYPSLSPGSLTVHHGSLQPPGFFQVLQGRISQIEISCGSVPSQLGGSPKVQCCASRRWERGEGISGQASSNGPLDKSKLVEKVVLVSMEPSGTRALLDGFENTAWEC